jgi:hypothetical protein
LDVCFISFVRLYIQIDRLGIGGVGKVAEEPGSEGAWGLEDMSAFFDENRDETIDRLFRISTEGDWEGWIEFCLRGVVLQARDTENRCESSIMMTLVISFQQKKIDKSKKKSNPA